MKAMQELLKALEEPDLIIEATVSKLIRIHNHSSHWTIRNQFLMIVQGATDAATYRYWKNVGRKVDRFDEPIWIIAPVTGKKLDGDGKPYKRDGRWVTEIKYFRDHKVFGIDNTSVEDQALWNENNPDANKAAAFLTDMEERYADSLSRLKLDKLTANGGGSWFSSAALQVNLAHMEEQVFLHEIAHAWDYKLGTITELPGQQPDNELVAEFAAAAIMRAQGKIVRHGCVDYLKHYAGADTVSAITNLMGRIQAVVKNIALETSHA